MKVTRLAVVSILFAWAAPSFAQEAVLDLDPAQTEIRFSLGDFLHSVHGTFKLKEGKIRFDPATGKASGDVIVDVTSGDSGSDARDRRMHKDILQSDRYPEAVFSPDKIDGNLLPQGESQVDIHGMFKIHGAAHEVTLHTLVKTRGDHIVASTHFSMPYVKWGMKNPSTFILRVSDHVELELHLAGRASPGTS